MRIFSFLIYAIFATLIVTKLALADSASAGNSTTGLLGLAIAIIAFVGCMLWYTYAQARRLNEIELRLGAINKLIHEEE